jgi:hypothetical protein
MAIVKAGSTLPSVYLEKFDPPQNVPVRINILGVDAIGIEYHWVDIQSLQIKGRYQCLKGDCCAAFGQRMQSYNIPVYVYRMNGTTEGDIFVWQMSRAEWQKFNLFLASVGDITQYDVLFTVTPRGRGTDKTYNIDLQQNWKPLWSPEQLGAVSQSVASFYQLGEQSLYQEATADDWVDLLSRCGWDFNNHCWPGGQSPMDRQGAVGAIAAPVRSVFGGSPAGVQALPQAPARALPAAPVGGVFQQAPSAQVQTPVQAGFTPVPAPGVGMAQAHSAPTPVASQPQGVVPVGSVLPAQVAPQAGGFTQIPGQNIGVPLGTAPVVASPVPVGTVGPAQGQAGGFTQVPQGAVLANTVETAVEVSAEEIDELLK